MTTHRNQEVGTSDLKDTPRQRESAPGGPGSRKSVVTHSDIRARLKRYFTPPTILTDDPAGIPAKRRYAHGVKVPGSVTYWRLIALPVNVVAGYVTWIADRPGRSLIVFGLWKLVILNPPGPWVVDNVFNPVGTVLAWLFL